MSMGMSIQPGDMPEKHRPVYDYNPQSEELAQRTQEQSLESTTLTIPKNFNGQAGS